MARIRVSVNSKRLNSISDETLRMNSAALKRLSVDDYLAIDRAAEVKSQYYDGELFAMAGGSVNHNLIAFNMGAEIRAALKGRPCRVFGSDMRVKCPTGLYTYPDVTVVCGSLETEGKREDVLLNPILIVEVLSPSTEDYDRGRKGEHYWSIPSLKEYVLVDQSAVIVQQQVRVDPERWTMSRTTDRNGILSLTSLGVSISVAEIYAQVDFATSSESPPEGLGHESGG